MREIDERDCQHGLADTEQTEIEKLRNRIRELEAELAALRQQQGEPVAEVVEIYEHRYFKCDVIVGSTPAIGTKLYREAAPRVPEGWKLVPVEPTEAMLDCVAGTEWMRLSPGKQAAEVAAYSAMLAAAPEYKQ